MADIKFVLKWLCVGLAGALWLHCAQFDLPNHPKTYLYVIGSITVACSMANLASRLPKSSRTRKTAGGDSDQEGMGEVQKADQVSASAERGSDSVQGGPPAQEQARVEIRRTIDREPLRDPDIYFAWWP